MGGQISSDCVRPVVLMTHTEIAALVIAAIASPNVIGASMDGGGVLASPAAVRPSASIGGRSQGARSASGWATAGMEK